MRLVAIVPHIWAISTALVALRFDTSLAEEGVCVAGDPTCSSAPVEVQIVLHNEADEVLNVYWVGSEERAFMGTIEALGRMPMNSYTSHTFAVATSRGTYKEETFTVKAGQSTYSVFGGHAVQFVDETPGDRRARLQRAETTQNRDLLRSFGTTTPVKFRNLSDRTLSLWYDDGRGGSKSAIIAPGSDSTTNSYPGHVFCFSERGVSTGGCEPQHSLAKVQVGPHNYTYSFDDGTASAAHVQAWEAEKAFAAQYLEEHGVPWSAYWPKAPPTLYMWPASRVGQVHPVSTRFGPFECPLDRFWYSSWKEAYSATALASISSAVNSRMSRHDDDDDSEETSGGGGGGSGAVTAVQVGVLDGGEGALEACNAAVASATGGAMVSSDHQALATDANATYHLEVLSASPGPKIFQIKDLMTADETDHIIRLCAGKVKRSMTGQADAAFESDTRTSKTTWLGRDASPVVERLYRRVADVLQLDHQLLSPGANAELMQVLHYDPAQKYDAHHDWGVDAPTGKLRSDGTPYSAPSRFITLLLYLNDPDYGGQTAFPKALGADGEPIALHPGKGSAVLFYNLLEDGNSDIHTLHAALPVVEGEKWLCNFWIWDPIYAH